MALRYKITFFYENNIEIEKRKWKINSIKNYFWKTEQSNNYKGSIDTKNLKVNVN